MFNVLIKKSQQSFTTKHMFQSSGRDNMLTITKHSQLPLEWYVRADTRNNHWLTAISPSVLDLIVCPSSHLVALASSDLIQRQ